MWCTWGGGYTAYLDSSVSDILTAEIPLAKGMVNMSHRSPAMLIAMWRNGGRIYNFHSCLTKFKCSSSISIHTRGVPHIHRRDSWLASCVKNLGQIHIASNCSSHNAGTNRIADADLQNSRSKVVRGLSRSS
eukprot:237434-Pleurochrysis_carterae.AAC.3